MKAYSATMIIGIIIAVIIGVAVLYLFWVKGMLPFVNETAVAKCRTMLINDCHQAANGNWGSNSAGYFDNLKACSSHKSELVSTTSNFDNCIKGKIDACKAMCQESGV